MNYELCKSCENFYQHYGLSGAMGVHSLYCGHCLKRFDKKIAKDNTCPNYKQNVNIQVKQLSMLNQLIKIEKELKLTIDILKSNKSK